ncbi:MAG TPA: leucyl/phenylalanyl-tRNA--protein transferase [Henriciella marina]|nr:leucyl/phenylalanyl-tRNA--protein transferase [Henriciella marina]
MSDRFNADMLLDCYRQGVFPMADSREDMNLFLISPEIRGVLPLDEFHVPRRLRKTVRKDPYRVTIDQAFSRVMEGCAEGTADRPTTWINVPIQNLYSSLHKRGYAHSIECWDEDGDLVGGLYGVSLGAAFFGESMFSRATDASKIALVHLVARLIAGGYQLLDAQFHNPHLEQFGLIEMKKADFMKRLEAALSHEGDFYSSGTTGEDRLSGEGCLHLITLTS